jgi:hypothetical protein
MKGCCVPASNASCLTFDEQNRVEDIEEALQRTAVI